MRRSLIVWFVALIPPLWVAADERRTPVEPVTLESAEFPSANSADEPLAKSYSRARAKHFLDSAALGWQKRHNCMTCHTNYLYLMARPVLGGDDHAAQTVRQFAEDLVKKRWPEKGPRWDAEVVMTALVLAFNDAQTTGKLQPVSRQALDRMWTLQRADGGFDWISCDWPPMESDDQFGATMAALAVAVAPDEYAWTPQAAKGIEGLKHYFEGGNLPTLHHRAMLLWADTFRPLWFSSDARQKVLAELLALQHDDGGFGLATLGDWKRADGTPQDRQASDGYATGLVVYLACRAGLPADDPRVEKGVRWLRSHQRASGRWFTRSLHQDSHHYLTHAGTSMAVLALAAARAIDD
jgi:squalene-hopene/tetraprenyl-beta-curcumene cyclase